ncbi:hypothetical protein KQ51_01102 [Candidatus Izimaplasma bacterium HR1]|jgi:prepilin-type N-terminal cleavage/methylation domain-containing protein|uniref:prepilin-type N-terminal cleavage/methylation domain-containing protein n=1 Tax=Candidatus Izimoplasma sp. HR1 TaxID=1541959 RepID=UPI0004F91979|nr:hypothetical protein KQ51_01102 [Candidatus Izimaplasma bacterium HR1]
MNKLNEKGFTLLELIVSIAVSSIVLSMLIQMLVMSVAARNEIQINSRLQDEAYLIAEQVKWNIFEHQTQSVSITETASAITVTFNHDWDITIDPVSYVITYEPSTVPAQTLVFDKDNNQITYDGAVLHGPSVYYDDLTTFTVTPVDSTCDPTTEACEDVVLTLTLYISVYLENGVLIEVKTFETTIII